MTCAPAVGTRMSLLRCRSRRAELWSAGARLPHFPVRSPEKRQLALPQSKEASLRGCRSVGGAEGLPARCRNLEFRVWGSEFVLVLVLGIWSFHRRRPAASPATSVRALVLGTWSFLRRRIWNLWFIRIRTAIQCSSNLLALRSLWLKQPTDRAIAHQKGKSTDPKLAVTSASNRRGISPYSMPHSNADSQADSSSGAIG